MQFHEFRSFWDIRKSAVPRHVKRQEACRFQIKSMKDAKGSFGGKSGNELDMHIHMIENEEEWYGNDRPYYKVYPAILDALCKIKLDFNCPCPEVPEGTISVRFAKGHEPQTEEGKKIAALLIHKVSNAGEEDKGRLFIQATLLDEPDKYWWMLCETNDPSATIEEKLKNVRHYKDVAPLVTRIALTVCMLAHDPDIITPDVLIEDERRYDGASDEWKRKAEKRAMKRGKFGWNIGKSLETTPHLRRPHLALRHTGPNRSIPKIVAVRACVVHREKLTTVPTGYVLPDGTEVEDGKHAAAQ